MLHRFGKVSFRMRTSVFVLGASLVGGLLAPAPASAADPTTADCLSGADRALDLRSAHKLRAAREKLLICAAASCPGDVRNECIRRLDQVNAAIPTIVFETKDGAGNDVGGVKVTMDGQTLTERLEGTALSIDPGEHAFTFEAPGQPTVQKSFVIREAEKERRERIQFGPEVKAPEGSPRPLPSGLATADVGPTSPAAPSHALAWTLMIGGAALGAAGVVVMVLEGGQASDANRTHDRNAYNAASTLWTVGLVGSLVGAAALAGGGIVFAASGSGHASASRAPAWLAVGVGSLNLGGAW
jgi:hypothetical protein